MNKNILNTTLTAVLFFILFSSASGYEKKHTANEQKIEKFRAHREVERLQKENHKKINLIEIISKNFGYTSYEKLKKDYWTARILVSKKQIIQAKEAFEKNKKDIDDALKIISNDYQKATSEMLDECINKLNEFEFAANINTNYQTRKKIFRLRNRIRIASQQYDSAYEASSNQVYISSISLYRNAKSYAINIIRDLAEPEEKKRIDEKFKIHIVDNRNGIFKKS